MVIDIDTPTIIPMHRYDDMNSTCNHSSDSTGATTAVSSNACTPMAVKRPVATVMITMFVAVTEKVKTGVIFLFFLISPHSVELFLAAV